MTELFDEETGELPLPNGAKAVAIAANARAAETRARLGIDNRSLNDAIERALIDIPVWIKAASDVAITSTQKAKYATLKDILVTVRPILLNHRIRIRQGADRSYGFEEGGGTKGRIVPVYTDLIHVVTGEVDRTVVEIPLTRLDPRAMGSAVTYGKRYSLIAALGLATDEADDDGARALPRDVTAKIQDSATLAALKEEINAIKTATDLLAWGDTAKKKKRTEDLTDDEAAVLRAHYQAHSNKLLSGEK